MAEAKVTMLTEERAFFQESLSDWLTTYPGRVVLVKGRELKGVFDTEEEAISEGGRLFGLDSFLVRRVIERPDEPMMPALTLGIISANPTSTRSAAGAAAA
jgi:hypothetical protein